MKTIYTWLLIPAFQCLVTDPVFSQVGEWTWMQGSDTITNAAGVFGIQGTPAPANSPPGFYEPVEWTDKQGNFWLFTGYNGGAANGSYGDVWKFDPVMLQWTWMHGTGLPNPSPTLGTQGIPAPSNSPGGFQWCGATWVDTSGNFWLFGGSDGSGASYSLLWMYDPSLNEWTWMNGPPANGAPGVFGVQGVPDPANYPTARWETNAAWTDQNNNLWLYGGLNAPGDYLWKYDISINQWTWVKGSAGGTVPVYGTLGVSSPANTPGAREVYAKWIDAAGDLWMFGGNGPMNDVWRYSIAANEWTWMSGGGAANYGTECISSAANLPTERFENRGCWYDSNGSLWFFGGYNGGSVYNDLWKYCPATNELTWVSGGQAVNVAGVYGTQGVSSPLNVPGARMGSVGWKDSAGNFWLWGGWVGISNAANDLWRFVPDPTCGLCSSVPAAAFTAPNHICPGTCTDFTNLSANATSYQWNFTGASPPASTDVNPVSICYNTPGNYTVELIATNASGSDTLILSNYITVYPYPAPQGITQSNDTLFANAGAVSYQWYFAGNMLTGATNYFYVAAQGGNYNVVATDANGCEVEAAIFDVVAGLLLPASNEEGLMVYPDPAGDMLEIRLPVEAGLKTENGAEVVSVYNMLGEMVPAPFHLSFKGTTGGKADVSMLPPGNYWIEVADDGKIFRKRFSKQ
jgi:PKD repeat protein